jgi:manganese/iron transport system permease protein
MAIVFSGMFALGLLLFLKADTNEHLRHVLFGNILGLAWSDVLETALIALPTIMIVMAKRRDFLLASFDPAHARALGLNVGRLDAILLGLLALAIVAAIKAAGVVLVIAMLIAPGAIGFLIARRFDQMLIIACLAATGASIIGLFLSFHLDVASGPSIVVAQALGVGLAILWRWRKGSTR